MTALIPEDLTFTEVGHLPIGKHFAQKLHLVETFDTWSRAKWNCPPVWQLWLWY